MWLIENGELINNENTTWVESAFTTPYPAWLWQIGENGLYNNNLLEDINTAFVKPYPLWLWRIENISNDGFPFNELIPDIVTVNLYPQKTNKLVHVYDSSCKTASEFDGNGYAIIQPISCTVKHEENGLYETQLEIIADEKNKYITGQAVLKVPVRHHDEIGYQLFRIYSINSQMDNSGNQSITANARHIFYDLNHRILRSCRPMSKSGQAALEWIFSKVINGLSNDEIIFNYYSDITSPRTAYYENTTVTAALLGEDNSFVNRWGGYLYRDNFYFSINREMEYSRKTGTIRYGSNMTDIDFTIDYSDCVTYLYAIDNFNNTKIVKNSAVPSSEFPHHIYKIVKFSYDEEDKEQFEEDAQAYYDNYKQPEVNIKVKFANLHDAELYADILELEDFDVGDKVIVYHKDLGINYGNLEIISRTYDAVNDKVTSIEIGTFKNAISRSEYMSGTVSAGSLTAAERQLAATQSQVDEIAFSTYVPTPITTVDGKYLTTADGKYLCYRKE